MAINLTQPRRKEGDSVGMEAGAAEAQHRLETIGASQSFDRASRLCEIDFSDTGGDWQPSPSAYPAEGRPRVSQEDVHARSRDTRGE